MDRYRRVAKWCFVMVLCFFSASTLKSQCLTGTTGLVTIPSARMQEDGTLSFGASYFDKVFQWFDWNAGTHRVRSAYVSLTFLPFLEVVLRVNSPDAGQKLLTVDRFPMVRLRIAKETSHLPAIAVGFHDFASTASWGPVYFNATYVVLSKKVAGLDCHLGYAPRIMKATYYQLDGIFGGVEYALNKSVNLLAEFDSRSFNAGIQYHFLKHFSVSLAGMNFESFAAGVNYRVVL